MGLPLLSKSHFPELLTSRIMQRMNSKEKDRDRVRDCRGKCFFFFWGFPVLEGLTWNTYAQSIGPLAAPPFLFCSPKSILYTCFSFILLIFLYIIRIRNLFLLLSQTVDDDASRLAVLPYNCYFFLLEMQSSFSYYFKLSKELPLNYP